MSDHPMGKQYIPLSESQPQVVEIPPGIAHGAINLSSEPCFLVNAVLRHGAAHPKDYLPLKRPFPYNLEFAQVQLKNLTLAAM